MDTAFKKLQPPSDVTAGSRGTVGAISVHDLILLLGSLQSPLLLLRGLPGSGKSSTARELRRSLRLFHAEADQYFVDSQGVFRFDGRCLGEAHRWCVEAARRSLMEGVLTVVANTFRTFVEIQPYLGLAETASTTLLLAECRGRFRSVHNVPLATVERMRRNWEPLVSLQAKCQAATSIAVIAVFVESEYPQNLEGRKL